MVDQITNLADFCWSVFWNCVQFTMAQEYFKPAEGGVLVDVSCGSGLFSRKFAKSGAYSRVVALDFSENMLRQCYDFIKNDETILSSWAFPSSVTSFYLLTRTWILETFWFSSFRTLYLKQNNSTKFWLELGRIIALVRADVSRLPFSSGSIDAVHAGAALHCWPSPSNAVRSLGRLWFPTVSDENFLLYSCSFKCFFVCVCVCFLDDIFLAWVSFHLIYDWLLHFATVCRLLR